MRYFLELSYDGTRYHGWQIQDNAISVQQVLNQSLSTILRSERSTVGSGRTDAGVHALVQVAHFDFEDHIDEGLVRHLNNLLPGDIAIRKCFKARESAHARFDAISRSYIYKIHCSKNPFSENKSYFYSRSLDMGAMDRCSKVLLQWTDFESFSKVHTDVKTFDCVISEARWESYNDEINFYVSANRFLRGMVRAMVGTMLMAGEGKINAGQFRQILMSKDRRQAGRSVPACGLYLAQVKYPKEIYI